MSNRKLPAVAKLLVSAKRCIDTREKWFRGGMWDDKHTKACAMGAMAIAAGFDPSNGRPFVTLLSSNKFGGIKIDWPEFTADDAFQEAVRLLDGAAAELYDCGNIIVVNDGLGFEAVHKCFDHAIRRALTGA